MCRMYPSSSYYHSNSKCKIISHNSKIDPESAVLYLNNDNNDNNTIYGLFNDKFPLHIIPHPKKENVFTNRISYDVINDAYYENGKKYIEFWDRGALYYENLIYATHYSGDRTYLRDTTALIPENFKLSASIIYKFDYSSYETLSITSLNLKLNCYDNNTGYQLIISISTNHHTDNKLSSSSPNHYLKSLKWNIIKETYIKNTNERMNLPKNLTRFMTKNNKIFYIKAEIIKKDHKNYQKNLQLFPYIKNHFDEFSIKKNFGLDVRVELSSSLIVPSYNISYEKCMIKSEGCDGLFNDKYKFNVLPVENMKNIYTHRISYNVVTNAYYENGKTDIKYLKRWDRGTLTNKNIYYSLENSADLEIDYISRNLSVDKKNQSAYVTWKFDYRPGNFYINSLKLRLKFHYSSQRSKIQWSIKLLPTRKNPNSEFKPINFPFQENNLDYIIDLTDIAKDEYGFILKAKMIGGKTQLFRQDVNKNEKSLLHLNDDNFDMDVEAKLKPNMICDEYNTSVNEKNFLFNDKNTSDFVIKLELEKNNDNMDLENFFYLHSKILTSISDYFKALFNSQMIESHNRFLKLYDIPLNIFENLLSFIYDDNLKNLKNLDDWVDLLYISSRFLIPKLVQICELSIREYVNFDNVEEIRLIARECNAEQLFKYCEMYKI